MENFTDVVNSFIGLINLIIPLLFSLTLVVIIWKVVDAWILHANDETKIKEGKQVVVVGILVLVVMTGIWGILSILRRSLFY